jgi:antitoxin component YwqK of YwqJK toxin-antitoxin module
MRILVLLILLAFGAGAFAQNKTNEAGRRVGYWKVTGEDKPTPGYATSAVIEEGEYIDGRKEGVWKTYYPSGKVKNEITYQGGRPKGPYTTYYENGQIEEKGNWSLNKNQGKFTRYYENGQVQQDFTFDEGGQRNGTQKYYYENGQLMIEGNWAGGKEDGAVKEYYEDGSLKSVRVFNGGKMDAAKSEFKKPATPSAAPDPDPEPVATNGNKVKTTVAVAQSDAKPNIGMFDGNGPHTLYNKNRQISQKGVFKNGRLMDGKVYKYDRDGILISIEIYQNGQYVGEGVITDDMK